MQELSELLVTLGDLTPVTVLALIVVVLIQNQRVKRAANGSSITMAQALKHQVDALSRNTDALEKVVETLTAIVTRLAEQDKDHLHIVEALKRIEGKVG